MRQISILFNSKGYLEVCCSGNATDKRILEVLCKAARQYEQKVNPK
jgi:hypothetical protein